MGVRRLTTYLKDLEKRGKESWENSELKKTNLIIDGSGLCFYFYESPKYKLNCEYGGEYSQMEEKVKEFFEKLKSNEVKPYIVFDGIQITNENKKLHRIDDRIRQNRNNLPGLTKQTIFQVLEELEVPYVVADYDADSDIASLANIMDCPVMANDSDFLIFDIKQGYIPFDSYTTPDVNVKRFYRNKVAECLGIQPVLLPLLASLLENDYVSEDELKPFKEKYNSPKEVAEFLSAYSSSDQAMTDVLNIIPEQQEKMFQETVENSVKQYQTKESNLHIHDYFKSGLHSSDLTFSKEYKESTSQNIFKLYRSGQLAKQCMSLMCERTVFLGFQNTSSFEYTKDIRTNVYKILMPSAAGSTTRELTEYCKDGQDYRPRYISIETQADDINIDTIEKTSEEDRVTYLLQTTLSCKLQLLKNVPREWWLVVAVLRYWYIHDSNKQVTGAHVKALLAYQVDNNANEHKDPQQLKNPGPEQHLQEPDWRQQIQEPDMNDLQGFLKWQDVVYWTNILYSLLRINSLPVLRPAKLYDGEKVWKLYTKLHNGIQAEKIVVQRHHTLSQQLYNLVSKKPKERKSKGFLEGNRFAPLSISSESNEED